MGLGYITNRVLGTIMVGTAIILAIWMIVGIPLNFIM